MQHVIRPSDLLTTRNGSSLAAQVDLFLADAIYADRRPATLAFYRTTLHKFLWWVDQAGLPDDATAITADHCKQFLVYLRTTPGRWGSSNAHAQRLPKPATVDAYWRALAAFWNWWADQALDDAAPRRSPMQRVERPKVPRGEVRPFDLAEVESLLARCDLATPIGCRNNAIIYFLFSTGLRASELCGLRLGDYDLDSGDWTVISAKTGHVRGARLAPPARRAMRAWLVNWRGDYGTDSDAIFINLSHAQPTDGGCHPLTPNGLAQLLRELGQAAGLTGVRCSPHTFRYSFACHYLLNGGGLADLQRLLGHATSAMTMRYATLTRAMLTDLHQQFDPAAKLDQGSIERARRAQRQSSPPTGRPAPRPPPAGQQPAARLCEVCDQPIAASALRHHPQQKYCGPACYQAARRAG